MGPQLACILQRAEADELTNRDPSDSTFDRKGPGVEWIQVKDTIDVGWLRTPHKSLAGSELPGEGDPSDPEQANRHCAEAGQPGEDRQVCGMVPKSYREERIHILPASSSLLDFSLCLYNQLNHVF